MIPNWVGCRSARTSAERWPMMYQGMYVFLSTDGKVKLWLSTLLIGIMKAGMSDKVRVFVVE